MKDPISVPPEERNHRFVDSKLQREIAVLLVDRFNEDLALLQDAHPTDFVHIDLRGTLNPEKDWENEIHPTRRGFRKITKKIIDKIYGRVRELLIERKFP